MALPWLVATNRHPALVYLARLAPSGRRSQGSALEQIARLLSSGRLGWQELPWHLVRYQHAAAVRSWLADHRAPSTANTYRAALRGVMRECWRLDYLEWEELARILEVESVRGARLLRGHALSRGELIAVFGHLVDQPTAAARRDAALVAVLYASGGVRRAEASGLQLGDLDQTTGRLVVRGKGNKEREVWLSDGALQAVEDWLQLRGEEPGALLLPVEKDRRSVRHYDPDGSPARLSESTVRLACRRRAAQAGLRAFSPHDLRRTSISDLLDLTGDLAMVSELAGHANPATTKRYDRRPAENRRQAARLLHVPYQRPASVPTE
jgi:integrase